MLYKPRNEAFKFCEDYSLMVSQAKTKANNKRETIASKITFALAKVKAGNNSKNLVNKIRKIVYSLYLSKEITKKVYNKIIKSIPL